MNVEVKSISGRVVMGLYIDVQTLELLMKQHVLHCDYKDKTF